MNMPMKMYENEDYPYLAPRPLPLAPVYHASHYPGYVLELSTRSFPLIGNPTRKQIVQSYEMAPIGLPQIGSFIHIRYHNEEPVHFGVRVV